MLQAVEIYETLEERLEKRQCLAENDAVERAAREAKNTDSQALRNHPQAFKEEIKRKGEKDAGTSKSGQGDFATSSIKPPGAACLLSLLPKDAPLSIVQLLQQHSSATCVASAFSTPPTLSAFAYSHVAKCLPVLPPLFCSHSPSFASSGSGPTLQSQLSSVLSALKSYTPYSLPFVRPVNRREVPDYYSIIRAPMDLQSMRSKLKAQQYTTVAQVRADLQLILDNCFTYNTREEGNVYRVYAKALFDKGVELLDTIDEPSLDARREKELEQRPQTKEPEPPVAAANQAGPISRIRDAENRPSLPHSLTCASIEAPPQSESENDLIDWMTRIWHRLDPSAHGSKSQRTEHFCAFSLFSSAQELLSFLHQRQLTFAACQNACPCPELVFSACLPQCVSQGTVIMSDGKRPAMSLLPPSSSIELVLQVIDCLRRIRTYRQCVLEHQSIPLPLKSTLVLASPLLNLTSLFDVIQVLLVFLGFEGLESRAGHTLCQIVERYITGLVSSLKYARSSRAHSETLDCHILFRQGNTTPAQGLSYLLWLRYKYPMKLKEIEHRFHLSLQQEALNLEESPDEALENELKDSSLLTGQLTSASAIYDSLELDWLGLKELGLLSGMRDKRKVSETGPKEAVARAVCENGSVSDNEERDEMDLEDEIDLELQQEEASRKDREREVSQSRDSLAKLPKSATAHGASISVYYGPSQSSLLPASLNGRSNVMIAPVDHPPITRSVIESSACLSFLRPYFLELLEKSSDTTQIDENKTRVWTERPVDHTTALATKPTP